MEPLDGKIVEIWIDKDLILTWVSKCSKDKLNVIDEQGKSRKSKIDQVAMVVGNASIKDYEVKLKRIAADIQAIQSDIDVFLLWDSLQTENGGDKIDIEAATDEYFGSYNALNASALIRSVLSDPIRFRCKGNSIFIRSKESVDQKLLELEKRRKKQAERGEKVNWIKSVMDGEGNPEGIAENKDLIRKLADFLLGKGGSHISEILRVVCGVQNLTDVAFDILKKVNYLPADADPWIIKAGMEDGFSSAIIKHIEGSGFEAKLNGLINAPDRTNYTDYLTISIDDEDTKEIDDAISFIPETGELHVAIHIADLDFFVKKGDALDRLAQDRVTSKYLPTKHAFMLPEKLSTDHASLNEGTIRPAVSFDIRFSEDGEVLNTEIKRGVIRVDHRLTYDQVDEMLMPNEGGGKEAEAPTDGASLRAFLHRYYRIVTKLFQKRLSSGALNLKKPELKIKVVADQIIVSHLNVDTPSRLLISESMILANYSAANFLRSNGIPCLYRVQDLPPHLPSSADESSVYDPFKHYKAVKNLSPALLTTLPGKHDGLGLDCYTQITSPIRRVNDLLIQRQLLSYVDHQDPIYTSEELMMVMAETETMQKRAKVLEQEVNRFHLLKFLENQFMEKVFEVAVLNNLHDGANVELREFSIRGKLKPAKGVKVDMYVPAKISRIVPEKGELIFRPVY